MSVETLVAQCFVNGLVLGMLYLLMAIGFTMVFGIMRVVNFAHGEFYMLGTFVLFFTVARYEIPLVLGLVAAALVIGLVGAGIERVVFRPFRGDELSGMIASIGVSIIIQNLALLAWGPNPRAMPSYVSGILELGPLVFPWARVFVIAAAALILALFYLFVTYTRLGRAMRAVVQDTEVALLQGIRAERIYPLAFGVGVGLAGLAGGLMAPIFSVSPFAGMTPILKAFVVVILGGLGSVAGAVLGGLLLGLIESFTSTFWGATMADIIQLLLVMLILVFRPWGLLGQREA